MTRLIARPISPSLFPSRARIVIWLIFGVLMWLLLERTTFGKNLFAIGVNRVTAKLSGVNVTWTNLATYSLAGALAGFGGFLVVGNTGVVMIQLGTAVPVPVHCGGGRRRDAAFRRQGQLLGHDGWRDRADAHHQPADHHADARFCPPHGAGRDIIGIDLYLRPPASLAAII